MCCSEPDDVQYDLSLYGCGQIIEVKYFCMLFAVPSTPMLCYYCDMPEVDSSRRRQIKKNSGVFSAFLFYREAFCYFQEAKLFQYIFLKTCAVMCYVARMDEHL